MPLYETDFDRTAEADIAEAVRLAWGFRTALKLGPRYCLDYALVRGARDVETFVGCGDVLAEMKNRPGLNFGFRDGYYLSAQKVAAGLAICERFGVGGRLVVRFANGAIHWVPLDAFEHGKLIAAGRLDRPTDITQFEPEVIYPWHQFVLVEPPQRPAPVQPPPMDDDWFG